MRKTGWKVGESVLDRFWRSLPDRPEDGCWPFRDLGADGYGRLYTGTQGLLCFPPKTMQKAHRISWVIHFGPIPPGQLVLHKCDNPPCVKPSCLFLGDNQVNMTDMMQKRRGANSRKTHCRNGHEFTPENTYLASYAGRTGELLTKRHCIQCMRDKTKQLTHCPRGHEYTEENTVISYRTQKGVQIPRRMCRACGYSK